MSATDIYDNTPWTDMSNDDLKSSVIFGNTPQQAAEYLCRSGDIDGVIKQAWNLGCPFPVA